VPHIPMLRVGQRGLQFCYQCQDFLCLRLAPCADKAQILTAQYLVKKPVTKDKNNPGGEAWAQSKPESQLIIDQNFCRR
jgi:hypothetical protein